MRNHEAVQPNEIMVSDLTATEVYKNRTFAIMAEPMHTVEERQTRVRRRNGFVADRHLLAAVIIGAAVFVCGWILILEMVGAFK